MNRLSEHLPKIAVIVINVSLLTSLYVNLSRVFQATLV
jgi:hypothetical protein